MDPARLPALVQSLGGMDMWVLGAFFSIGLVLGWLAYGLMAMAVGGA